MLSSIKSEVGMIRWPVKVNEVEDALNFHFLSEMNKEIERLDLPALEPMAKRQRMEHVDETPNSQVCGPLSFYDLLDCCSKGWD